MYFFWKSFLNPVCIIVTRSYLLWPLVGSVVFIPSECWSGSLSLFLLWSSTTVTNDVKPLHVSFTVVIRLFVLPFVNFYCLTRTEAEQSAIQRFDLWHRLHGSCCSFPNSDEWELLPSGLPQDQLWVLPSTHLTGRMSELIHLKNADLSFSLAQTLAAGGNCKHSSVKVQWHTATNMKMWFTSRSHPSCLVHFNTRTARMVYWPFSHLYVI